jgi:hypothetical protein
MNGYRKILAGVCLAGCATSVYPECIAMTSCSTEDAEAMRYDNNIAVISAAASNVRSIPLFQYA